MNPSRFASAQRILIVKPSSLGDIIHTLPLLALLREHARPGAEIRWLVNETWAPLLHHHPLLDGVIEFPRHLMRGWSAPARLLAWSRGQSTWRPELAIDVQGLLRSLLLAKLFRPEFLVGYSDAREGARFGFDSTIDVRASEPLHAVDRYLKLAVALGWELPRPVSFPLPPGQAPLGSSGLADRFVLLHPFSRGAGKSLTTEQVDQLCAELSGIPLVLVGRAETADWVPSPNVHNFLNRTSLPELVWLLQRAAWTVSVDSGPMHLASAVSPRVLSLHTWSDPLKVGPYPDSAWAWKAGEIRSMAEWRGLGNASEGARGHGAFPDSGIAAVSRFVRAKWEGGASERFVL